MGWRHHAGRQAEGNRGEQENGCGQFVHGVPLTKEMMRDLSPINASQPDMGDGRTGESAWQCVSGYFPAMRESPVRTSAEEALISATAGSPNGL
jgi:hypothetical protein